jgi:methylglutaconyl-CoA hydratase
LADPLRVAADGGCLRLTLDRPDKRNALNAPMLAALGAALETAELDAAVRVVVLRGAGSDFCAGADLVEMLASADQPPEANARAAMVLGDLFLRLRALPKPVVAIVHGRALAGGCGLATACDMVLALPDAQFGYPEVRRGFVPAMVMAMLVRAVGEKHAFDLVATGRTLTADEAYAIGLVSRVVDDAVADQLVADLAAASPTALALIKRQLYQLDGLGFAQAVRLGADVNAVARGTADFREAVQRFLAR